MDEIETLRAQLRHASKTIKGYVEKLHDADKLRPLLDERTAALIRADVMAARWETLAKSRGIEIAEKNATIAGEQHINERVTRERDEWRERYNKRVEAYDILAASIDKQTAER